MSVARAVAKQAVAARLPFAGALRSIKRRVTDYAPDESNIGSTFFDIDRLQNLMYCNQVFFRGTVLEIGSGWFPIMGIMARLRGADRVILSDVKRNMDARTWNHAKTIVLSKVGSHDALRSAQTPEEFGLTYLAPFDPKRIPNGSLDLVVSRACFEHIPVPELERLLKSLRPKLKPSGAMAHAIDNSDHYSHSDPELSRINFLTWSAAKHRALWRLARGGENRLRHHQYAELFARCGYSVAGEDSFVDERVLREIPKLSLAEPYRCMSPEQLAVVSSWYVLRV